MSVLGGRWTPPLAGTSRLVMNLTILVHGIGQVRAGLAGIIHRLYVICQIRSTCVHGIVELPVAAITGSSKQGKEKRCALLSPLSLPREAGSRASPTNAAAARRCRNQSVSGTGYLVVQPWVG
jgi:hypothetical protein